MSWVPLWPGLPVEDTGVPLPFEQDSKLSRTVLVLVSLPRGLPRGVTGQTMERGIPSFGEEVNP